ncbi:MAG: CTP synthase [Defluviitaleaceae bacterium]|nr:CTP synthase [Defluviitaleaceae bacterium]
MQTKYIFITGGVASGLGKGVTAASHGRLLKARGYTVTINKFDPYINIDPGTMSPYQHGEVFVTDDGGQTDLDIGHYERFIDESLSINSNTTAGKIYWSVLTQERDGFYNGKTVQVIPHITDSIQSRIFKAAETSGAQIVITEVGGTVGDIESLPFLEAIRQFRHEAGHDNVLYVHVPLIPRLSRSDELKTKPAQHSVKQLLSLGIQPDIIVCRTERPLSDDMRDKLALFCNVRRECVIQNIDCELIYEVPLLFEKEGFAKVACAKLGIADTPPDLAAWEGIIENWRKISKTVNIALVGKYVELHDAYLSVTESLLHAGLACGTHINISWIDAESITPENAAEILCEAHGMIVPGGFGERGVDGMIAAVGHARRHNLPTFGICLGMQCMLIEFARSAAGLHDAASTETAPGEATHLFSEIPQDTGSTIAGGAMRLGAHPINLGEGTAAAHVYSAASVSERHRHKYRFDTTYRAKLEAAGMVFSGISADGAVVEIAELPHGAHPFFLGVQFHPEFKSRPNRPHPLFNAFISKVAQSLQ